MYLLMLYVQAKVTGKLQSSIAHSVILCTAVSRENAF